MNFAIDHAAKFEFEASGDQFEKLVGEGKRPEVIRPVKFQPTLQKSEALLLAGTP